MLRARQRLNREQFTACFSSGKRWPGTYMQLVTKPDPLFRAAVVVSKKVAKKAHVRNRLRRQIYDVLRTWSAETAASGSLIVFVKPSILTLSARERRAEVCLAVGRLINTR